MSGASNRQSTQLEQKVNTYTVVAPNRERISCVIPLRETPITLGDIRNYLKKAKSADNIEVVSYQDGEVISIVDPTNRTILRDSLR